MSEPYEVLRQGKDLVESTLAHVSHGGPTREEAEAWLELAKEALVEPDVRNADLSWTLRCVRNAVKLWEQTGDAKGAMEVIREAVKGEG